MTPSQFNCCCSAGSSPTREAARLVLVEGLSHEDAIAKTGIALQTLRNTLVRIRSHDAQIRAAYIPAHPTR